MARPLRIEYPGAVYHVITRGNNRQAIFTDERDRITYLQKLGAYCEGKEVHLLCYCLLSNHVHLLLETPLGNLSKLMQPLQTSYTLYFNRRHRRMGHVFAQRYKALVVDRDNYLLQVSRYIHLNPVGAKLVQHPQDYRWSSYRAYLKTRKDAGVHRALILGQFAGRMSQRIWRYREFVEGTLEARGRWSQMPIRKQVFVGDEDFVEAAERRVKQKTMITARYSLTEIIQRVGEVTGIEKEELRRAAREVRIQRGREIFSYVARRYSGASLGEIVPYLGARDLSTVSHGVKRAEARLQEDRVFRQQVERIVAALGHSSIQA